MQSGRGQRELWSVLRKSGQEMANGIQARPWEREMRPWATTRPIKNEHSTDQATGTVRRNETQQM